MDRPLEIEGELLLDFDGGSARIDIRDEMVDVRVSDTRAALSMMSRLSSATRRQGLRNADAVLRHVGLAGRFRVGDRTIARLGGDGRPGPLARLLGVDPLALNVFALLGSLFDRRPVAEAGAGRVPTPEGDGSDG